MMTPERILHFVRLDEVFSTLSNIGGERDKGATQNLAFQSMPAFTREQALTLYKTYYGGKIVDSYVRDSFRRGYMWSGKQARLAKLFKNIHADQRMMALDRWSMVYGSHYMLVHVDDGKSWDQPVRFADIGERGIRRLITADCEEVIPETYIEFEHTPNDADSDSDALANPAAQFGEPLTYQVRLKSQNLRNPEFIAHTDRVIRFDGIALERSDRIYSTSQMYPGAGESIYVRVNEPALRLGLVEGAMATLISEFNVGALTIKGLRAMLSGDQSDELIERFSVINMGKSICNMIPLEEGESFDRKSISLAGLPDIYDRLAQSLASAAEMSMTDFYGQAPGGLTTDDKAGRVNRENVIHARQLEKLRPAYEYLARLALKNRNLPELTFLPLNQPTDLETAEARKKTSETDQINQSLGIVSKKELRKSRFGGQGYSSETTLLDETPDAEAELVAEASAGTGLPEGRPTV